MSEESRGSSFTNCTTHYSLPALIAHINAEGLFIDLQQSHGATPDGGEVGTFWTARLKAIIPGFHLVGKEYAYGKTAEEALALALVKYKMEDGTLKIPAIHNPVLRTKTRTISPSETKSLLAELGL